MSAVGDARKRQHPAPAVEFIRRLINAWDCCGTCAGGVLAERDRELKAVERERIAQAIEADPFDIHWRGISPALVSEAQRHAARIAREVPHA